MIQLDWSDNPTPSAWQSIVAVLLCLLLVACGTQRTRNSATSQEAVSKLHTDLGYLGNSRAERRFEDYIKNLTTGCSMGGANGKRILISGFGPFNRSANIYGAVVRLLQNKTLWPDQSQWPTQKTEAPVFAPSDDPGALGARAVQRTVTFENEAFELCLVITSVEWDLAAAIVLHEANQFNPYFILMTGYGTEPNGMRIESAALNTSSSLSGYDPSGRYLAGVNTPESDWVIPPAMGLPETIEMSWETQTIAEKLSTTFQRLNQELNRWDNPTRFRPIAMREADPRNNYICNNIGYVIAASLRLPTLPLAGNRIRLQSKLNPSVGVGFAHYPHNVDAHSAQDVWLWTHVVLSLAQEASNKENSLRSN